ncbi:MAG: discoidin domain-containing protein [Balneolaceae bacterium]
MRVKVAYLVVLFLMIITQLSHAQVDNRIPFNDQELWLNGGNIAWVNFARDVGPGTTAINDFEAMYSQVQENGANAMRFWVHITGGTTPEWNGNNVISPGAGTIDDLEEILDLAWENNTGLILCLWSFDMLRISNGTGVTNRAKALLEDSTLTETYIQNSLIPMVEALGDHPALIAWEIFNEPEGMSNEFGWDFNRHVPMSAIQRFVNQTAGAIHRTNPDALVSNGSWSFHALANTSNANSKNYYSDDELISAGKDSLGTLDFYMVHYYDWGGTALSPFHNDKDSWGLNKPVVVGEFGIPANELFGLPKDDMYEELYDRGYAGALVWQWVDWYQNRGGGYAESWLRGLDQMRYMQETYPNEVIIKNVIPSIRSFKASLDEIESGGQTELSWEVLNSVSVELDGESVDSIGSKIVAPIETTEYMLIATGLEGDKDSSIVTVQVVPAGQINRALSKPSRSSTYETCCGLDRVPSRAFDGNTHTRWSSAWRTSGVNPADPNTDSNPDSEWIDVDLGLAHEVSSVLFNWEAAYSLAYDIQTSFDGINWKTVFSESSSDGGIDSVVFIDNELARFVRMQGNDRATEFGHSIWEFEVRGAVSITQPPSVSITSPDQGKNVPVGINLTVQADATDSDGEIEYVSFFFDGDSIGVDNTAPYSFTIPDISEGEHEIYVKTKDDDMFIVQSSSIFIEGRTDIFTLRLEAEDAKLSGATSVKPGTAGASKGASVSMEGSGSIKWENLNLPIGDDYEITVRHYLPFDYKEQFLSINEVRVDTLVFDEPIQVWKDLTTTITPTETIQSISIDHYWGFMDFDYVDMTIEGVSVSNEQEEVLEIPTELKLDQNYPNPFNPTTNISYTIPVAGNVELSIYSLSGQKVVELVNERQPSGQHVVSWDASTLASGIYFYRITTGNEVLTRKMVLIK